MLRIDNSRLDAVLFTHEHADHTAGLDDLRPYCFMESKSMPIYGQPRVIESLKRRFDYVFETENRYPGAPSVIINEIEPYVDFQIENNIIRPRSEEHTSELQSRPHLVCRLLLEKK